MSRWPVLIGSIGKDSKQLVPQLDGPASSQVHFVHPVPYFSVPYSQFVYFEQLRYVFSQP